MKYYLHDSTSFNDEKITELYLEFGYEGLGLFYTILEKLALQEKPIKTIVLKHQLNVGKKLEKCWKFMEEIDLISSNNGETFNKQLLNFSKKYQVNKEKNAKRISEWRENQSVTENVTSYKSVRNDDKVKESKVKESKVKEQEDNILVYFNTILPNYQYSDFRIEEIKKWISYKIEKKEKYTKLGFEAFLKKWDHCDDQEFAEMISSAMASNWKGLFKPKKDYNGNSNDKQLGTSAARMEALRNW